MAAHFASSYARPLRLAKNTNVPECRMFYSILFYFLAGFFILALIAAWFSNLFGLPGNWIMLALNAVWFLITDPTSSWHIGWPLLILFAALAGLGELIEFGASVLGTRQVGGSRPAAICSVVGSVIGGIVGSIVGLPIAIPLVGMIIGSVLFACLGAMIGATLAEKWQGSELNKSVKVGGAAFAGRLVGTVSKITLGAAILVISILAMFVGGS
jgi:uncharacterized protein YqgC (DUF456 family)